MAKLQIKKNDTVIVIAGKDKGKTGVVSSVDVKGSRVIVDGLNLVKKHVKARSAQEKSEIKTISAPIHVSNVMLIDPKTQQPTRVSIKTEEKDGKKVKVRICKKSGTVLEAVSDLQKKSAAKKASKSDEAAPKKKAVRKTSKKNEAEE